MPAPQRNIRLTIAYDGSDFGGWQRQKNAPTVQEALEAALRKMHGHAVPTAAAGRTDAGVHALGQVVNFYTDIGSIPAEKFVPALGKLLPHSIRVMDAREAHFDFHSRFDARLRRYRYFILSSSRPDPFRMRYAHWLSRRPDLGALNSLASRLLGEVDFTALSSARDPSRSKRRFVHEASFRWEGDFLVFEIAANAFLLRMVRSIVGTLLHFEVTGLGPEALSAVLAAKDRSQAGPTAPARGLFFWNAEYYAEPRKPGRGAYWASRGLEAEEGEQEEGLEEDREDRASGARPEALRKRSPQSPAPHPPAPEEPMGRLVPGIGFIKEDFRA